VVAVTQAAVTAEAATANANQKITASSLRPGNAPPSGFGPFFYVKSRRVASADKMDRLILRDGYDVPEEVARGPHSTAFSQFLRNWFGDTYALTHGELDLTFLKDLTPQELALARELVRRNLKLKQNHIIEGTSALNDIAAIPILQAMLEEESDASRQQTIAGALWKLSKDTVFIECLHRAKASGVLGYFGMLRALWLDDARSIDFLIDLLPEKDRDSAFWRALRRISFRLPFRPLLARVYIARAQANAEGFFALSLLNQLEFGRQRDMADRERWRPPSDYRKRRDDPAFREYMTAAVHKWNLETNKRTW
jgi:hypothetical protein